MRIVPVVQTDGSIVWLPDAERELKKIPFFVRGKAKRQHREIRRRARRRRDQRRDPLRREGPLCAMTATSPATAS
jgi:hypothetical protein